MPCWNWRYLEGVTAMKSTMFTCTSSKVWFRVWQVRPTQGIPYGNFFARPVHHSQVIWLQPQHYCLQPHWGSQQGFGKYCLQGLVVTFNFDRSAKDVGVKRFAAMDNGQGLFLNLRVTLLCLRQCPRGAGDWPSILH